MKVRVPVIKRGKRAGGYAARPESLKGLRVGFLDGWGNSEGGRMYPTMAEIERRLLAEEGVAETVWQKKPTISMEVPADELASFADSVDVVVNGEGLCGSCTAASVLDAVQLEAMGKPTVTIIQDRFEKAARLHARNLGLPGVAMLIEPAPGEGNGQFEAAEGLVENRMDFIRDSLTTLLPDMTGQLAADSMQPSEIEEFNDWSDWDDLVRHHDWTDGLPVAPPTDDIVKAIIDYLGRDPYEIVGLVPPTDGIATIEQVAIQCAMAGCRPEHVPVVLAALDAMLDPRFNLHGVQCTTWPGTPLAIVSGPIVRDLGFNVSTGALGGGGHANVAIGRAIRLIMWNLGGGKPAVNDLTPIGGPHKFAYCVAENADQSPFAPLHTDFGFDASENVVTLFAASPPSTLLLNGSAERILNVASDAIAAPANQMYHGAGQALFAMSIKPADAVAAAGFSKTDVREYIFEHGRPTPRRLKDNGLLVGSNSGVDQVYWGETGLAPKRVDPLSVDLDERLQIFESPDDIRIIVTGGDTQWWGAMMPGWGRYGGFFTSRRISVPR